MTAAIAPKIAGPATPQGSTAWITQEEERFPKRYTTVSMTFLALYLLSWSTTVKSISRVGLATAYSATRRSSWMLPRTIRTGENATARNATTMMTGLISKP